MTFQMLWHKRNNFNYVLLELDTIKNNNGFYVQLKKKSPQIEENSILLTLATSTMYSNNRPTILCPSDPANSVELDIATNFR